MYVVGPRHCFWNDNDLKPRPPHVFRRNITRSWWREALRLGLIAKRLDAEAILLLIYPSYYTALSEDPTFNFGLETPIEGQVADATEYIKLYLQRLINEQNTKTTEDFYDPPTIDASKHTFKKVMKNTLPSMSPVVCANPKL